METDFAAPERATDQELAEDIRMVSTNPVVSGLLHFVGGIVAILDTHRQVVAVNDSLSGTDSDIFRPTWQNCTVERIIRDVEGFFAYHPSSPQKRNKVPFSDWRILFTPTHLQAKGDNMAYDEILAQRMNDYFKGRDDVEVKKMFGGLCYMVSNHMCCGITGDTLMARVGPDAYAQSLAKKHVREMDFTGKSLKGMVYVSPEGISTDSDLQEWIGICEAFIRSLPPKKQK